MDPQVLKLLIKDSKRTKRLDLSHQNLDEIPQEVINLHHLEKLKVNNNNLTELPDKLFKNNKGLKEIDVSHNKLETLPASIGLLESLEMCDASDNRLKTLPSTFSNMFLYSRFTSSKGYGSYWKYHQYKIKLQGNNDLEISPELANDDPNAARDHYSDKAIAEEDAKEEQAPILKAKFAEEKERQVERNLDKKKLRKLNEKEWSKSRRYDRQQ